MTNEAKLTREEAHWSSFRSAVVAFQDTLGDEQSPARTDNEDDIGRHDTRPGNNSRRPEKKSGRPMSENISLHPHNSFSTPIKNAERDDSIQRNHPQSRLDDNDNVADVPNSVAHHEKSNPQNDNNNVDKPPLDPRNSWEHDNTILEPEIEQQQQQQQHLELIGLEEVNKGAYSRNIITTGGNHTIAASSPANTQLSHASHATMALSMAEHELAEMKLKLAMTESERDELEFKLMQQINWN
mmetsp:Transcript_4128/g.9270  ORF Transcript_4128/g.9270 Transcript_4128/m.9270 type:complete len:241 (+) Transcript_4128:107-829(+)